MKSGLSCLIMVCFITAVLCGCNNIGADNTSDIQSAAAIDNISSKEEVGSDNFTGESIENTGDGGVEVEYPAEELSVVVKSTKELKEAIKSSRVSGSDNKLYNQYKLQDIEYFYEPAVIFPGYELLQIEVLEYRIFYYYMPESLMKDTERVTFNYGYGIVFTIARPEGELDNPLQPITEQTGIEPNKDNVVFDKRHNSITWPVDRTWADIRFPKAFADYEEMLSYCKVNRLAIDN